MLEEKPFKFNLGDGARIIRSLENGEVSGRAEFLHGDYVRHRYLVRYLTHLGCAITDWFEEDELALYSKSS